MPAVPTGIDFDKLERIAASGSPQLSSDARWKQILGLMQFASNVMKSSPEADRILAFKQAQEAEWQRVQRRLFANVTRA